MKLNIETIRLRNLARSDAPLIRVGFEDGVLARNLENVPYPFHKGAEYEFIERVQKKNAKAIVGYVNGMETLLGFCGMHADDNSNDFTLGYMVFEKYWNHGVGTRAIELLMERAPYGAQIIAEVMYDNPASKRVFEKLGFERSGESESVSKGRNGAAVPSFTYVFKNDDLAKAGALQSISK